MATLIPKLSLTSQDYLTDPLNLETSYRVDGIADPKEFSTRNLSTSSATTLMPTNSSYSYFYIKVLDNTQIVKAQSILGKCKIEYGYWSRATS